MLNINIIILYIYCIGHNIFEYMNKKKKKKNISYRCSRYKELG